MLREKRTTGEREEPVGFTSPSEIWRSGLAGLLREEKVEVILPCHEMVVEPLVAAQAAKDLLQ